MGVRAILQLGSHLRVLNDGRMVVGWRLVGGKARPEYSIAIGKEGRRQLMRGPEASRWSCSSGSRSMSQIFAAAT